MIKKILLVLVFISGCTEDRNNQVSGEDSKSSINNVDYYVYRYDNKKSLKPNSIEIYTFDSEGKKLYEAMDYFGDGNLIKIKKYFYNDDELLVRYEKDSDGDGNIDLLQSYAYSENGVLLKHEEDSDGDGNIDRLQSYVYSKNGILLKYEDDVNNNGYSDFYEEYNDQGDILIERWGLSVKIYEYDKKNILQRITFDKDGKGVNYYTIDYIYDDRGNLIRETKDILGVNGIDFDGFYNCHTLKECLSDPMISEWDYTFKYNQDNMLTKMTSFDWRGNATALELYTYDTNNNLLTHIVDGNRGVVKKQYDNKP